MKQHQTKSERRETRQRKSRYSQKGATKAAQKTRLETTRGYVGSAKKLIKRPRLTFAGTRV